MALAAVDDLGAVYRPAPLHLRERIGVPEPDEVCGWEVERVATGEWSRP